MNNDINGIITAKDRGERESILNFSSHGNALRLIVEWHSDRAVFRVYAISTAGNDLPWPTCPGNIQLHSGA